MLDGFGRAIALRVGLALALAAAPVASIAAYAAIPGQFSFGVAPPAFPSNPQQCEAFTQEAASYGKRLGALHDECLEANRGNSGARPGMACTAPACERLHRVRDKFVKTAGEEGSACFKAVSEAQASMYRSFATEENIKQGQRKLLSGPYKAVLEVFKNSLELTFREAGLTRQDVSAGVNVGRYVSEVWPAVSKARESCQRQLPAMASIECEKQVFLSVQSLQGVGQGMAQKNQAISFIQQAMLERLNMQNRANIKMMQDLAEADEDQSGGVTIGR